MTTMRGTSQLASTLVGAAAVLWQTRSGGSIRTIITGRSFHPTGRRASYKNGRAYPWESPYEELLLRCCEAHPDVSGHVAQPHMLEVFRMEGESDQYYPDLRVDFADGSVAIVEVSSAADRRKAEPEYVAKLVRCRQVYEDLLAWRFEEISGEAINRDPAFRNLIRIERDKRTATCVADELRIFDLATTRDPFTYAEACEALGGFPKGSKVVHALMVRGLVEIEVFEGTINVDTPVTFFGARRRLGARSRGSPRRLPGMLVSSQ